jgi:S-adenosylmethionine:tRNA ribosyltransferase-isomerase
VRPYRRLRPGEMLDAGGLRITVADRLGEGRARVELDAAGPLEQALERAGEMPLPPYITEPLDDPSRYQTVYARRPGSAAAPTAGLHFTDGLWRRLRARNEVVEVTLDVGLDTFRPLTADVVEEHRIHSERYVVSEAAAAAVEAARADGRRIVAVGTTTVRVLETVFGEPRGPLQGRSRLLITPGFRFRATGAMVTNFHLPRSTLLALVMAFAGEQPTRDLYRTAVLERYRFYSFGDASLIL